MKPNTSKQKPASANALSHELESTFDNIQVFADRMPHVPDCSEYEVIVIGCRQLQKFGRSVLLFSFQIASQGQYLGLIIPTFVNFPVQGRGVAERSKVASWLRLIQDFDPAINIKKMPLSLFGKYQFVATVETVTIDYRRQALPTHEQYSKVADLTAVTGRTKS